VGLGRPPGLLLARPGRGMALRARRSLRPMSGACRLPVPASCFHDARLEYLRHVMLSRAGGVMANLLAVQPTDGVRFGLLGPLQVVDAAGAAQVVSARPGSCSQWHRRRPDRGRPASGGCQPPGPRAAAVRGSRRYLRAGTPPLERRKGAGNAGALPQGAYPPPPGSEAGPKRGPASAIPAGRCS
jgi:hypothetical protein